VLPNLAKTHGVPESWSASEDEQAAANEEAAAMSENAQLLDVGERASLIAKNMSGAGLLGGPGV
jgi:hypothetical protein